MALRTSYRGPASRYRRAPVCDCMGEVFVDPILDRGADYTDVEEGCLSLPGVVVKKRRLLRIQLLDGRTYINEQVIVIQHEIDHLKGILINDAN